MSKRIKIQESLGTFEVEQVTESTSKKTHLQEGKKYLLKPTIEAIHAGLTKNDTFYPSERLQGDPVLESGVYSWTAPYFKPMIKNHNTNEEPLGRITEAKFVSISTTGKPAIVVTPTITDQDAIEKILDGRYVTVSIGAETDSVTCSICGKNLLEEEWGAWGHEHQRGETYDGEKAYWIIGNIWFHELSFVNVPADRNAMVINPGVPTEVTQESFEGMVLNLDTGELVPDNSGAEASPSQNAKESDSGKEDNSMKEDKENQVKDQEVENPKVEEKEDQTTDQVADSETNTDSENKVDEANEEPKTLEEAQKYLAKYKKLVVNLSAKNSELEGQVQTLTDENKTLKEQAEKVPELEERLQEAESKAEEAEEEEAKLLERVTVLEAEIHKGLAERVVDLKITLGRISAEERQQEIEDHAERTKESLEDALKDLQKEASKGPRLIAESIVKVQNPGHVIDGEDDVYTEGLQANKKDDSEELNEYGILKNLFTGRDR